MDHQAFIPGVFESEQPNSAFAAVLKSIEQSAAYQEWETITSESMRVYLLEPTEMWARAYAQWVTRRSGSPHLAQQLVAADRDEFGYWQKNDFGAIESEINKVFAARGWL